MPHIFDVAIDLAGNTVANSGEAVADTDVPNWGQVKAYAGGTGGSGSGGAPASGLSTRFEPVVTGGDPGDPEFVFSDFDIVVAEVAN